MIQISMVQKVKIILEPVQILAELLREKSYQKPLFVCDEGIVKCGILEKAVGPVKESGMEYAVFSKVIADPPQWLAQEGIDAYREAQCDCIVGIGGGSAIDTAKAINILRFNEGPIMKYAAGAEMKEAPGLIVVPTTSGTGSEMSDGLVITEGHTKAPILADKAMCEYAILDPEMTVGLPASLTAMTGYDVLAHAAEAYTSQVANVFTDMVCEKIMETVAKWLPVAVADGGNLKARQQMSLASCLGGWMLAQAHSNAGHSIAHVLGGHCKLPHGLCCAYALPETVAFNAAALPEKTAWIAGCFGESLPEGATAEEIGQAAKRALVHFRDVTLGIQKAEGVPVDPETAELMIEEIINEPFQTFNPVKMEKIDAEKIINQIFYNFN